MTKLDLHFVNYSDDSHEELIRDANSSALGS